MSEFSKKDKNWLLNVSPGPLTPYEITLVESAFDADTDLDVQEIEKEMKHLKFLKKVCILKLLTAIPEYLLLFGFEKKYRVNKIQMTKLYYQLLFNKISLDNFRNELKSLMSSGII